jgi:hypothetical protein
LLAQWHSDFDTSSEHEPDLTGANYRVVDQGIPPSGLELFDGLVG